jgi:hypothetical protein
MATPARKGDWWRTFEGKSWEAYLSRVMLEFDHERSF